MEYITLLVLTAFMVALWMLFGYGVGKYSKDDKKSDEEWDENSFKGVLCLFLALFITIVVIGGWYGYGHHIKTNTNKFNSASVR